MGAHAGSTKEAARGGGPDKDPDWGSIGICLDGFFETDGPSEEQLTALTLLIDDLRARFPRIERVIGHREVAHELVDKRGLTLASHETTCPGSALFRTIEDLRIHGRLDGKPQPLVKLEVKPKSAVISDFEPLILHATREVSATSSPPDPL
jgi:hypothetical protein